MLKETRGPSSNKKHTSLCPYIYTYIYIYIYIGSIDTVRAWPSPWRSILIQLFG